jgi:hypothetical protein
MLKLAHWPDDIDAASLASADVPAGTTSTVVGAERIVAMRCPAFILS